MKIKPIDVDSHELPKETIRIDSAKPVLKSRLKRLFDRQFPSVLRISSVEKPTASEAQAQYSKDGAAEFEPSSVCLAKMVQNFIEESNEKQSAAKYVRNRCNCFNGNSNDSSDDEFDVFGGFGEPNPVPSSDASDLLKNMIQCASVSERNLLADAAKIVDKNKTHKRKDDLRKIVTDGFSSLGYDSSICKSKWDKTHSFPAGEHEYIDVMVEGERLLVDIDFRSEFEIARSTGAYNTILQSLPFIFVGNADRLQQIVTIVSEAARQSMKKEGMPFPPWRKAEYMRAKWLSPYCRTKNDTVSEPKADDDAQPENKACPESDDCGELALIFGDEKTSLESDSGVTKSLPPETNSGVMTWQPPAIKPKSVERGAKIVTGLASLLEEKS